jgi:hypothetical protein
MISYKPSPDGEGLEEENQCEKTIKIDSDREILLNNLKVKHVSY